MRLHAHTWFVSSTEEAKGVCSPLSEEFMVDRVLAGQVGTGLGPKEVAELGASGYDLAELEIDGVGHDDSLFLYHFGQAE